MRTRFCESRLDEEVYVDDNMYLFRGLQGSGSQIRISASGAQ